MQSLSCSSQSLAPIACYDFAIVGAGLVGASLALALADLPLKIVLIDEKIPTPTDPRLLALNASSCALLKNLNIWEAIHHFAAPIQTVHVSHKGRFGAVRLTTEDLQLDTLGYVIPAYQIESCLQQALITKNIAIIQPAKVTHLIQHSDQVDLHLQTQEKTTILKARFVIGADGTHSTVRKSLNLLDEPVPYAQSALVTTAKINRAHNDIAYERFLDEGALAVLPLPNQSCAIIWTAALQKVAELKACDDQLFLQHLQATFGYRVGRFLSISNRFEFPLFKINVKNPLIERVLLLGNAAHTMPPLAAQGFNVALYEVAALAEGIRQESYFTPAHLQQIVSQTKKQRLLTFKFSDYLARLPQQSALFDFALQIGMNTFDMVSPLKRTFIKRMLGRRGRVPRLLLTDIA